MLFNFTFLAAVPTSPDSVSPTLPASSVSPSLTSLEPGATLVEPSLAGFSPVDCSAASFGERLRAFFTAARDLLDELPGRRMLRRLKPSLCPSFFGFGLYMAHACSPRSTTE